MNNHASEDAEKLIKEIAKHPGGFAISVSPYLNRPVLFLTPELHQKYFPKQEHEKSVAETDDHEAYEESYIPARDDE